MGSVQVSEACGGTLAASDREREVQKDLRKHIGGNEPRDDDPSVHVRADVEESRRECEVSVLEECLSSDGGLSRRSPPAIVLVGGKPFATFSERPGCVRLKMRCLHGIRPYSSHLPHSPLRWFQEEMANPIYYTRAEYIETVSRCSTALSPVPTCDTQDTGNKVSRRATIAGPQNIILGGKTIISSGAIIRGDLRRTGPGHAVVISLGRYCLIGEGCVMR